MPINDLASIGILAPFVPRQNTMMGSAPGAAPAAAPGLAQPGITAPFVQQATATPGPAGASQPPPAIPGIAQPFAAQGPAAQGLMPAQPNQLASTIQQPFAGGSIYGR